jgi:hypothetical protein
METERRKKTHPNKTLLGNSRSEIMSTSPTVLDIPGSAITGYATAFGSR